jgi:peptidyl-prolyl cis-trans isomerase A (cyclophilin A)
MDMRKWFGLVATAVLAVTPVVAKGQSAPQAAAKGATPARSSGTASPFDRALLRPSLLKAQAPESYQVKFVTTRGEFTLTVTRAWAPQGADRFYNLVRHHFYDNASFFRAIANFMVQFGLSAHPPVSAAWSHAEIKDDPVVKSNLKGYISFATAGPNTRTTQVFINLVDNTRLNEMGFAPFGQVTEGMEVVQSLYTGYGEGAPGGAGPDQGEIEKQGKPYLDKGWPKLDSIKTATIVGPPGASGPAKSPAKPAAKPSSGSAPGKKP